MHGDKANIWDSQSNNTPYQTPSQTKRHMTEGSSRHPLSSSLLLRRVQPWRRCQGYQRSPWPPWRAYELLTSFVDRVIVAHNKHAHTRRHAVACLKRSDAIESLDCNESIVAGAFITAWNPSTLW
eukprot:4426636-Pleurochrysis_carterae.AAC.1